MPVEALIGVYGDSYDAIRLGTATFVEQLWLELGGPDARRAEEFADAALEVVNAAAGDVGVLVDGYVSEYAATVSRRPPAVDPLDLAELVVDQLRGVPGRDVYMRPAVTARAALAAGKPFEQAMADAGARANSQAAADVGLAHREAARMAMENTPGVDGYRRVLTGKSCTLCRVASTQRYRTGELMPIHTRCDCRIAPLVDGTDYGRIVNRDLYRELRQSGELARLNAANRGTTGRSRAAAAKARRAAQPDLAGREQTALDLRPPDPTPVVRQHGELGPVLVDERHTFTGKRRGEQLVTDSGDLRQQAPARPPTPAADDVPTPPPAQPAERAPRWTVDSPDVIRAAQRRNVSREQVVADLEAKRARRLAEQAADRAEARALTVDHPDIVRVADRYGVTPDEVFAARGQVPQVRRAIADAATRAQLEAFETLDHGEALKIGRPPRLGKRTAMGRVARGGEYDWLEQIDERERARLSRVWYTDDPGAGVDVIAQQARDLGAIPADWDDHQFVDWWLYNNRRYEAAGAIRRGNLPSQRAYSGHVDVDDIVHIDGYQASQIVGKTDLDAAGHIAQANRQIAGEDALNYLGKAADARHGPRPYTMSYQAWFEEVAELEYGLRNYPAELPASAWERLGELVPEYLDEPGTSFEELYTRIITTARRAGEEVPDHARIPWQ